MNRISQQETVRFGISVRSVEKTDYDLMYKLYAVFPLGNTAQRAFGDFVRYCLYSLRKIAEKALPF